MADFPDSFTANILAVDDLISSGTNKMANKNPNINPEGVVSDKMDVLDLPMADDELLSLRDEWEKAYAPYEGKIKETFKRNLRSYLGRTAQGAVPDDDTPTAANLQFEAEETFLAAALASNPDPLVYADNSEQGNAISNSVKSMLQFHADQLILHRKLALMVRQWSIYQLGVLKPGWNMDINDVALENRKVQDFVFDPNGYVDAHGDFSSWLGERITVTANKLIELFPKHRDYITDTVGGKEKLGTEVIYTEWWNDDYCFSTFRERVLDKHKNEYFNYDEQLEIDSLTGQATPPRRNHFALPKKPYIFLSVYSLQERPHDITGLLEQNIPNQQNITRGIDQIESNVSQGNNGIAFSENNFNQESAKQAATALTKGVGKVLVPPGGPIAEAIVRIPAPNIPNGYFDNLENNMNNLRSSWGVQGIASQQQKPDETARGMILNQGRDTSRIGGGIGDAVEQVARNVFNWLTQIYSVFYDQKHFAAIMGVGKSVEYVTLQAQDIDRQLIVSVAENSMMPRDEVSLANQAIQLFEMKAIGPKILLEQLNFPSSDEAAADGVLWTIDPQAYLQMNFPELAQQLAQMQQQAMAAQQQAQAQQVALEGQAGQQKNQQAQQAGQQQLQQKQAAHQQQMQHGNEAHEQKMTQTKEATEMKMKQLKAKMPK